LLIVEDPTAIVKYKTAIKVWFLYSNVCRCVLSYVGWYLVWL